jgi:hypothetical protein
MGDTHSSMDNNNGEKGYQTNCYNGMHRMSGEKLHDGKKPSKRSWTA